MNVWIYTVSFMMCVPLIYLLTEYFIYIIRGYENKRWSRNHCIEVIFSFSSSVITLACIIKFNFAVVAVVLVLLASLHAYYFLSRKERKDFIPIILSFGAGLLNYTTIVIIVMCAMKLMDNLPWEQGSKEYDAAVMIVSNVVAMIAIYVLRYSREFPNAELCELMHTRGLRNLLMAYLCLFSFVQFITLYSFESRLSVAEGTVFSMALIISDIVIKAIAILVAGYGILIFLCKINNTSMAVDRLNMELERESVYRQNLYDDAIIMYCVDIEDDCILDGGEAFTNMAVNGVVKYSEAFRAYNERYIHPDDLQKMEMYTRVDELSDKFKGTSSRIERVRISKKRVIEDYGNVEAMLAKNFASYNNRSEKGSPDESNDWIWVESKFTKTEDINTGKSYLYITISDINDRVNKENEMKLAAEHDPLTGLYNRAGMKNTLDELFKENKAKGSLFLLDVDNFKRVNDNLGHPQGDRLLVEISQVLKEEFRDGDIVARLGGDEFIVFSPKLRTVKTVEERSRVITKRCHKELYTESGDAIETSVSIGILILDDDNISFNDAYSNCDKALYKSKEKGKNTYTIFSDTKQNEKIMGIEIKGYQIK